METLAFLVVSRKSYCVTYAGYGCVVAIVVGQRLISQLSMGDEKDDEVRRFRVGVYAVLFGDLR